MAEWIDARIKLPDNHDLVFVTVNYGDGWSPFVETTRYDLGCKGWDDFNHGVIAWMPIENLPEPYEIPSQGTAKWEDIDDGWTYQCSKCGYYHRFEDGTPFKFCPECGSKMTE